MMAAYHNVTANSENGFPEGLGRKPLRPMDGVPKRSVLSTLSENYQPQKNAHQTVFQKSSSSGLIPQSFRQQSKATKSSFVIYDDSSKENIKPPADESEPLRLSDNITRLYKYEEPPLAILSEDSDTENDSPMALDTSSSDTTIVLKDQLFLCPDYAEDIYSYLKGQEVKFRPSATYIRKQPDITSEMRSILVDWLVEVCEEYKMLTETLFLAVSYIDRFLSHMSVLRCKLQLVGTAALFTASKYEEIYPPELKEFVYITDDTYNKRQIIRMEHLILKVLAFDLSPPTAHYFLNFMASTIKISDKLLYLAQYICEISLLEAEPFLSFLPSEIASSSLIIANYIMGDVIWPAKLQTLTGYTVENLVNCIRALYERYSTIDDFPQKAIREKYSSSKFRNVANMPPPDVCSFML